VHPAVGRKMANCIVFVVCSHWDNRKRIRVVVEVKSATSALGEFHEDLQHLRLFLDQAGYFSAFSLVYGEANAGRKDTLAEAFGASFQGRSESVTLYYSGTTRSGKRLR
jgi:hypothetical protein